MSCEALICVKDIHDPESGGANLARDCQFPKQGDVITVQPAGTLWGTAEIGGARWGDILADTQAYPNTALKIGDRYYIEDRNDGRHIVIDPITFRKSWVFDATRIQIGGPRLISQLPVHGNHPQFRVIKFTHASVTAATAANLLAREVPTDMANPSPYLQYRGFFLDKSKIPTATMQALIDHWNDDLRTNQYLTVNYTAAQINSIVSKRPALPF